MNEKKPNGGRRRKPAVSAAETAGSRQISGSPMDVGLLRQLVELMAVNDLSTVDVRDGDRRIILKRGAEQTLVQMPAAMHAPSAHPGHAPAPVGQGGHGGQASQGAVVDEEAGLKQVKSPMVGTFYSKASPESKPFVAVGSQVDEDTDVCVIEAMKVFNNIKAECRGTIAKVLVQDGQPVEFGTVLFLVRPLG